VKRVECLGCCSGDGAAAESAELSELSGAAGGVDGVMGETENLRIAVQTMRMRKMEEASAS
jgi:hypothetical protein